MEFELVKYRVSDNVTLPFKLMPVVKELGRTRLAVHVNLRSLYGPTTVANEVRVHIPMPKLTARANVNVTAGKAKYVPEERCLRWKIKQLAGHEELQLDAEIILANTLDDHKAWVNLRSTSNSTFRCSPPRVFGAISRGEGGGQLRRRALGSTSQHRRRQGFVRDSMRVSV